MKGGKGGASSGSTWQDFVAAGRRQSEHFNTAWKIYCKMYANGLFDPTKYEEPFIVGFIDYLGQVASLDLKAAADEAGIEIDLSSSSGPKRGPPMGATDERPAKRAMFDVGQGGQGGNVGKGGKGGGFGNAGNWSNDADPEQAELVAQVKANQRSDSNFKQAWWTFCESQPSGNKDPARYDAQALREFLESTMG